MASASWATARRGWRSSRPRSSTASPMSTRTRISTTCRSPRHRSCRPVNLGHPDGADSHPGGQRTQSLNMLKKVAGSLLAPLLVACGQAAPGTGQPSATPTPKPATARQLTDLGAQIFPYLPQFQYYTTCINLKENGAPPPGGPDSSACPITDVLRARLQATQANFCPCDQNPSTTREIKVTPRPGGGLVIVLLYGSQIKVEMVAVNQSGKLLANDLPGRGDVEPGTGAPIAFAPKPTPTPTAPPLPSAPPGTGSRVLNVPWYHQVYVLSCESASLRMALGYEGIATTDPAVLDIIGADLGGPG